MKHILYTATIILFLISCNNSNKTEDQKITPTSDTTSATVKTPAEDEIYTCTMHNEVMSKKPGTCSKCGMKLVKQKMTAAQQKMMKDGTYTKSKEEL